MTQHQPAYIVPFSHLDLFWTGTREECLSRGNLIIARALDLLEQHEDFRFLIETMNFLAHYLDCYPADEARVRRLAQSGRLELAPLWTGIYQNLPGGETLVRNTLYAKRCAKARFACDPEVAHFGDLPGFTPQFPQIAARSGIKHALLSRGGPASTPLFHWQSPDGSAILAYYVVGGYAVLATCTDWHKDYADMLSGRMAEILTTRMAGKTHPTLFHWGCDLYAPNEQLILNARRWNAERQPQLRFATFREFFAAAAQATDLPTLAGELPSAWPNIESSWPDIWPEDLPCEAALQMAEFLAVCCRLRGWTDYPQRELEDAWKALLDGMDHNQNGQGGERADRDKLQLKRYCRYAAERIIERMAWRLAAHVPRPAADMTPIVVFNAMSWKRTAVVTARAAVFGSERSSDIAAYDAGLRLVDDAGNTVPYVPVRRIEALSLGLEFAFLATDVPATGYRTYYLVPGQNPIDAERTSTSIADSVVEHDPQQVWRYTPDRSVQVGPRRSRGRDRHENRFFRIEIDVVTGEIDIHDLRSGSMLVRGMHLAGIEERRGNYIFDMTPSGRSFPAQLDAVDTIDNNAVWQRIRLRGSVYGMPFTQTITLYHDLAEITVENTIDWQEPRWVRIEQVFPYAGAGNTIRYGVPYGQVTYPEVMPGEQLQNSDEVPAADGNRLRLARHWADIGNDDAGLCIGSDHRMWEFCGTTLRAYMLRGAGYCAGVERLPDGQLRNIARPPPGQYVFRYVIRPRQDSLAASAAYRCGWELNRPLLTTTACGAKTPGTQPASASLIDLSDSSLVVTALKQSEDGDAIVLRGFESAGLPCAFQPPALGGRPAQACDLLEQGRQPVTACRPYEITTVIWDDAGSAAALAP
jgi:alpha-mannosidase